MAFLYSLFTLILTALIGSYILFKLAPKFKLDDKTYLTALKVSAIFYLFVAALSFLFGNGYTVIQLIIGLLIIAFIITLGIYLFMSKYRLGWKTALKLWSIWFGLTLLAGIILGLMIGLVF